MPELISAPPVSEIEPVTEVLHGVAVTDPYRWLEDQNSSRTRRWISEQTDYARSYLDNIPGRDRIQARIREFLAVETYDSLQRVGNRYFFRKRLAEEEQPCIYMREGIKGEDQLLVNPSSFGRGIHTAVKLLKISPDGRFLLYEIKQGGERTGTFELLEIETRTRLPDTLPRGLLRGFVFSPDGRGCYYSHETPGAVGSSHRSVYYHLWGSRFSDDLEIFNAGADTRLRLFVLAGSQHLGIIVNKCFDRILTDFYLRPFGTGRVPTPVLVNADYRFEPILANDRILALTSRDAPNYSIVEVLAGRGDEPKFVRIIPEHDVPIRQWAVVRDRIFLSYISGERTEVAMYDLTGNKKGEVPTRDAESITFIGPLHSQELVFEADTFTEPPSIWRYCPEAHERRVWSQRDIAFRSVDYGHRRVWYTSKDGTRVPMFLVGLRGALENYTRPTIMTSYGGFGATITPQFSVFVALLVESGCLFALPCIRGGGEFGARWHEAAKRRNRQNAFDDFLCAAEWLIQTGRTNRERLAIFGGSNGGLLVGAALTQRPELFCAVLCIAPMLDMLRYHLFDEARIWKEEFGTAEDADDFSALLNHSPYHQVRPGIGHPAVMFVSGDADTNCNPLHARKMTARLQNATGSSRPILLDYSEFRGHSPVLPLSERIRALTDRIAFFFDQLQLPA